MHTQRIIVSSLASMFALGLVVAAAAHTAAPQPNQTHATSSQFYPGTESMATYPIPHGTLTVNAGMPANAKHFGPPPTFRSLDRNDNGRLSQAEAKAYPPLANSFLYASGGAKSINLAQYKHWASLPR